MHPNIKYVARFAAFAFCVAGGADQIAAQGNTVAADVAVPALQNHESAIWERERRLERAFYGQWAGLTMIAGFRRAGVSEATIEQVAHSWAGGGLQSDFLWTRPYFNAHAAALRASISHVRNRGEARADELDRINRGMDVWKSNTDELHRLFVERVKLHAQAAKAIDIRRSADAIECDNAAGCQTAKARINAVAKDVAASADEALGRNRDAIALVAARRVLEPIADGEPASNCAGMTISYQPGAIRQGQQALPTVAFVPKDCRSGGHPTFSLEDPDAPFELDAYIGTIRKTDNLRSHARVEARLKTSTVDLVATTTVIGEVAPPCTGLAWTYVPRAVHLREWGTLIHEFTPRGCLPSAPVSISTDRPDVLMVDQQIYVYGRTVGEARVNASAGMLQAPVATIAVVNDGKEECKSIELNYWSKVIRVGTQRFGMPAPAGERGAELTYEPAGCKQPEGAPRFSLLSDYDATVLALDSASGAIRGLKAGWAKVIVAHGNLPGKLKPGARFGGDINEIQVVDRPACDHILVTVTPNPIRAGQIGRIDHHPVNMTGGLSTADPEAMNCSAGGMVLTISSGDPSVASVSENGISGVAPGAARITLKLERDGNHIEGYTDVRVRP